LENEASERGKDVMSVWLVRAGQHGDFTAQLGDGAMVNPVETLLAMME